MKDKDLSLCRLSVYLKGDSLRPDEISKLVGFEPTEGRCKGEAWATPSNKRVVEKTGHWIWTRSTKTNDVGAELSEFLLMFPEELLLGKLPGVTNAFLDVFIANTADESGGGEGNLVLSPQCLTRLATIALPLQVTIAILED